MIEKINSLFRYGQKLQSSLREFKKNNFRSPEWKRVREEFLDENPFCAACHSHKHLQVHHVRPFHIFPELELDPNNLITLCMDEDDCHLMIGHGGNFSCFNPYVREDAEKYKRATSKSEQMEIIAESRVKRMV